LETARAIFVGEQPGDIEDRSRHHEMRLFVRDLSRIAPLLVI